MFQLLLRCLARLITVNQFLTFFFCLLTVFATYFPFHLHRIDRYIRPSVSSVHSLLKVTMAFQLQLHANERTVIVELTCQLSALIYYCPLNCGVGKGELTLSINKSSSCRISDSRINYFSSSSPFLLPSLFSSSLFPFLLLFSSCLSSFQSSSISKNKACFFYQLINSLIFRLF